MNIGDRIRRLRERRDWTQKKLAEKVGINHSVFNRIESGERKVRSEELMKIAEVLDVTPSSLLGREENESSNNINDAELTIQLIDKEAKKLGLSPNDPVFKKMLSDAFELLRLARGKDNK